MKIYLEMHYHRGTVTNPRPSLKLVARAHRQDKTWHDESLVHTRLVDCAYPVDVQQGMITGLKMLGQLRWRLDPIWGERADALALDQKDRMPNAVRTAF